MDTQATVVIEEDQKCDITVFLDIGCKISNRTGRTIFNKKSAKPTSQNILSGASGALRPGRLTFILGPSGAGKTTLLNILAGRKKTGVTGCLHGAGRNIVLVPQHATLIENLTAGEILHFAASLNIPHASRRERHNAIESITRQIGIYDVINTRTGRLSGGERKRVTIACELLTDPQVMLLDEPTSGLDTVSSMSVTRALLVMARSGRTIGCVVHQPSSQLFNSADDVILLANGRTLYAGSVTDVPGTLGKAGFVCPQYYNMADYLLEIATSENSPSKALLESEANSYAQEMRKIAKNDLHSRNSKALAPESEALLNSYSSPTLKYRASVCQQLRSLLWRCVIGSFRDVHLTQIRLLAHLIVALLLGALYSGAGADAGRIITNTGCLFFFLLFIFFSNAMPTIHTFPSEATVVLQEHLNRWYSLPVYCISKIVVDIPIQLLCATVFLFPAWTLTTQPLDVHRMGLAWLICALVTILAQTFGLVVGAACGMKLGLFVIPAANIPMLMFSEFFIPYSEIPAYLRPFATISYFRYAFDAFLQTVYGFGRETLPCHKAFCMFRKPNDYLDYMGLSRNISSDIVALVLWIVLLQLTLFCVLAFRVYRACR
ncbi:ATP-binding cassette sub-family G member 1 isoform X1 [Manduca sexta]|uniref:ATP-binding cassette sub-family G member 1 isoform X1 n=1 Tax=Manduca sexta TaxID=7130 RepID=UPI001890A61F|nr:ATP-binding cassette sub-family G member 1 isoform X1 [Manduca sexta]